MDKTAALKNAIDYAKKNPDSDDAIQLRKRLESGMYKNELARIQAGKFEDEKEKTKAGKILEGAKAAVGGFAAGVGGVALTVEDWAARKGLFGKRVKSSMEGKPTLQEEFRQEMGGNKYKNVYNVGRFGGEVASLAAPVSTVGKITEKGTKVALNATKLAPKVKTISNISKITRAGAEGAAFTAGMSLQEGKNQSLEEYGLQTGLNMVFPVAGIGLKAIGESVPSRIINSLIKPLQKDFAYGKNPGRTISELGIIANDFDTLISKIDEKREEIGQLIGNTVSKSKNLPNVQLDDVLKPIDEAIAKANKSPRTNSDLIKRLEDTKADLMDNIATGTDPQALKKIVGDLTKWTGNASDDKAINMSLKQTYGRISSKMDEALKSELSESEFAIYKKAQEQYGDLISAKNAATYRDKILERQNLVSFGAKNMGVLSALTTAIATGGTAIPTILAGLGGIAIDKAMATPAFKTRLATVLSKLAPKEIQTFFEKVPTAKALFPGEKMDRILRQSRANIPKVDLKVEGEIPEQLKELYKMAPEAKDYIDNIADELSTKYNGFTAKTGLKKIERSSKKVIDEYKGDYSKLTDIARNTVVVDKSNTTKVFDDIISKGDIQGSKMETHDKNILGYSGGNIKIKAPNGHIAEIQVNTPDMIYAKEPAKDAMGILGETKYNELKKKYDALNIKGGLGHVYYEQFRNLPFSQQIRSNPIALKSIDYYSNFQ